MVYFSKSSCISLQSAGVWCHHECGVTLCINLIHLNVKSPARFFGWVVLTGHFDFLGYELFFLCHFFSVSWHTCCFIGPTFSFLLFYLSSSYFKEWQRKREIDLHPLHHSLSTCNSQGWARTKPEASMISAQVFPHGWQSVWQGPKSLSHHLLTWQFAHQQEASLKAEESRLDPGGHPK